MSSKEALNFSHWDFPSARLDREEVVDPDTYLIESITRIRRNNTGKVQFLTSWQNYHPIYSTWEEKDHLINPSTTTNLETEERIAKRRRRDSFSVIKRSYFEEEIKSLEAKLQVHEALESNYGLFNFENLPRFDAVAKLKQLELEGTSVVKLALQSRDFDFIRRERSSLERPLTPVTLHTTFLPIHNPRSSLSPSTSLESSQIVPATCNDEKDIKDDDIPPPSLRLSHAEAEIHRVFCIPRHPLDCVQERMKPKSKHDIRCDDPEIINRMYLPPWILEDQKSCSSHQQNFLIPQFSKSTGLWVPAQIMNEISMPGSPSGDDIYELQWKPTVDGILPPNSYFSKSFLQVVCPFLLERYEFSTSFLRMVDKMHVSFVLAIPSSSLRSLPHYSKNNNNENYLYQYLNQIKNEMLQKIKERNHDLKNHDFEKFHVINGSCSQKVDGIDWDLVQVLGSKSCVVWYLTILFEAILYFSHHSSGMVQTAMTCFLYINPEKRRQLGCKWNLIRKISCSLKSSEVVPIDELNAIKRNVFDMVCQNCREVKKMLKCIAFPSFSEIGKLKDNQQSGSINEEIRRLFRLKKRSKRTDENKDPFIKLGGRYPIGLHGEPLKILHIIAQVCQELALSELQHFDLVKYNEEKKSMDKQTKFNNGSRVFMEKKIKSKRQVCYPVNHMTLHQSRGPSSLARSVSSDTGSSNIVLVSDEDDEDSEIEFVSQKNEIVSQKRHRKEPVDDFFDVKKKKLDQSIPTTACNSSNISLVDSDIDIDNNSSLSAIEDCGTKEDRKKVCAKTTTGCSSFMPLFIESLNDLIKTITHSIGAEPSVIEIYRYIQRGIPAACQLNEAILKTIFAEAAKEILPIPVIYRTTRKILDNVRSDFIMASLLSFGSPYPLNEPQYTNVSSIEDLLMKRPAMVYSKLPSCCSDGTKCYVAAKWDKIEDITPQLLQERRQRWTNN